MDPKDARKDSSRSEPAPPQKAPSKPEKATPPAPAEEKKEKAETSGWLVTLLVAGLLVGGGFLAYRFDFFGIRTRLFPRDPPDLLSVAVVHEDIRNLVGEHKVLKWYPPKEDKGDLVWIQALVEVEDGLHYVVTWKIELKPPRLLSGPVVKEPQEPR